MPSTTKMKRFSVSVEPDEYAELRRIADEHRPPLSLQYVVRYALQRLFDEHRENQLKLPLDRK